MKKNYISNWNCIIFSDESLMIASDLTINMSKGACFVESMFSGRGDIIVVGEGSIHMKLFFRRIRIN